MGKALKFGDPNHKPEIAVTLDEFESFVGFVSPPDLEMLFTSIPTLSRFINGQVMNFNNDILKKVVRRILSSSDEVITEIYTP
jgi:mannose-6-phosphate isomerase